MRAVFAPAPPHSDSIARPSCSECGTPTLLVGIEPERAGYELLTFQCPRCEPAWSPAIVLCLRSDYVCLGSQADMCAAKCHVALLFFEHGLSKMFGFPQPMPPPSLFSLSWFSGAIEFVGGGPLASGRCRILLRVGSFCQPTAYRCVTLIYHLTVE